MREVLRYEVPADPQQIDRMKRIVRRGPGGGLHESTPGLTAMRELFCQAMIRLSLRCHAAASPQAAAAANRASVPGSGTALIFPEPPAAGGIAPPLAPVACEPSGEPAI